MKVTKTPRSAQHRDPNPPMVSARKLGHKKRNPIMASMPGWPAPKKTPPKRKFS